jgi:hypothetical protein
MPAELGHNAGLSECPAATAGPAIVDRLLQPVHLNLKESL